MRLSIATVWRTARGATAGRMAFGVASRARQTAQGHLSRRTTKMTGLNGRVALITGSSRGIGAATALTFAREGADVAINYHANADAAAEVAAKVRALGRRAEAFQADVTSEADCQRLANEAVAAFGRVDILVNNAGVGASSIGMPTIQDT